MGFQSGFFLFLFLLGSIQAEDNKSPFFRDFHDPRSIVYLHEWIVDGKEKKSDSNISNSILIISWMPVPDRSQNGYQISGIEGYHSLKTVEKFLKAFYADGAPKGQHGQSINVLIAGNNWGSGRELKSPLLAISKKNSISIFYAGGWGFQNARLTPEPDDRLKLIKKAFGKVNPEASLKTPKKKE